MFPARVRPPTDQPSNESVNLSVRLSVECRYAPSWFVREQLFPSPPLRNCSERLVSPRGHLLFMVNYSQTLKVKNWIHVVLNSRWSSQMLTNPTHRQTQARTKNSDDRSLPRRVLCKCCVKMKKKWTSVLRKSTCFKSSAVLTLTRTSHSFRAGGCRRT